MKRILIGCVVSTLLAVGGARAEQCGDFDPQPGTWAWPSCENAQVIVGSVGGGVVNVNFVGSPPDIEIQAGDNGFGDCVITIVAGVPIGDVTVFGSAGGPPVS